LNRGGELKPSMVINPIPMELYSFTHFHLFLNEVVYWLFVLKFFFATGFIIVKVWKLPQHKKLTAIDPKISAQGRGSWLYNKKIYKIRDMKESFVLLGIRAYNLTLRIIFTFIHFLREKTLYMTQ
jgi:hypothetical protein